MPSELPEELQSVTQMEGPNVAIIEFTMPSGPDQGIKFRLITNDGKASRWENTSYGAQPGDAVSLENIVKRHKRLSPGIEIRVPLELDFLRSVGR